MWLPALEHPPRFFYFFSAVPLLFLCVALATTRLFQFVEWYFYRDALYYLDSIRRTARALVFMCLMLPWFVVCFWEAWCPEDSCQKQATYKAVSTA